MTVEITYADEFDKEYYPFSEKVYGIIEELSKLLYHPNPDEAKWKYFCTIHGAIFKLTWADAGITHRNGNLGVNQIKFLADVDGLRWVESKEDHFTIGLEFRVVK